MASSAPGPRAGTVVLTKLDTRFDRMVDGISRLELWSLWLVLDRLPIAAAELRRFLGSFLPASVEVWHVSDGGSRSDAIRRKIRAFGEYPKLAERVVSEVTLDIDGRSYYSDIARAASDPEPLAAFLGRSTASADSVVVVQPEAPNTSRRDWATATLPLAALWLDRSRLLATPAQGGALLTAFLQTVTDLGAIPVLLGFDASMRPTLAAVGTSDQLTAAASKVQAVSASADLDERLTRGLGLQALV